MREIPSGFRRHFRPSSITAPWEPLYSEIKEDRVRIGLVAGDAHTNSRGYVHGGLIATLADSAMGLSCGIQLRDQRPLITINLSIDFMRPVRVGQWLVFDTAYTKVGRSVCFAQCFVTADSTVVALASAVYKG